VVFDSSLPHVVVSTFLFAIPVVIVAHFRSGMDDSFTSLFGIAALHGSQIPSQVTQMKSGSNRTAEEYLLSNK
jgi:hypothetical protein